MAAAPSPGNRGQTAPPAGYELRERMRTYLLGTILLPGRGKLGYSECELIVGKVMQFLAAQGDSPSLKQFLETADGKVMVASLKTIGVEFICDQAGPGWKNVRAAQEPDDMIAWLNDLNSNWAVCRNTRSFLEGQPSEYWKKFDKAMGDSFKLLVRLMKLRNTEPANCCAVVTAQMVVDGTRYRWATGCSSEEGTMLANYLNEKLAAPAAAQLSAADCAKAHQESKDYVEMAAKLNNALLRVRPAQPLQREVGWLIEAGELSSQGPMYLFVEDWGGFAWTLDSLKAVRFARQADAEQVIAMLESVDCKATEHQWG